MRGRVGYRNNATIQKLNITTNKKKTPFICLRFLYSHIQCTYIQLQGSNSQVFITSYLIPADSYFDVTQEEMATTSTKKTNFFHTAVTSKTRFSQFLHSTMKTQHKQSHCQQNLLDYSSTFHFCLHILLMILVIILLWEIIST